MPLASPLALSQGRLPLRSGAGDWDLRKGFSPAPSGPSPGTSRGWKGRPFPVRTSAFAFLLGNFPPGINSAWSASPTASGCRSEKALWTSGRPPAGLCPPNARRRPTRRGLWWGRRETRKDRRASRAVAGPAQPARPGSPGSGAHSAALGHVLRARGACRGPRAKPAGRGLRACAPRSPRPHPLPGASAARGRERAVPGFAARRPGVMGPTGAPGPLTGWRPSCTGARPDACLCWQPARQCQVEKVTGLWGAPDGVALWTVSTPRGAAERREPPRGQREAGREMGSSGPRASEQGSSHPSWGAFPGNGLGPPGTAVTYRGLVGSGFFQRPALAGPGLRWAWSLSSALRRPPQFCLFASSHSLPRLTRPREFSPQRPGPPSITLFIYGAYLLSSKEDL